MQLLKRLFTESGEENPASFRLSVKLNSGDYMEAGGSRGSTGTSPLASRLWPGRFRRDLRCECRAEELGGAQFFQCAIVEQGGEH